MSCKGDKDERQYKAKRLLRRVQMNSLEYKAPLKLLVPNILGQSRRCDDFWVTLALAFFASFHFFLNTAPPMSSPIIRVERLSKTVSDPQGELLILSEIDFELQAKETAAIVGASGSGKSTLLSIMAGLDRPSQGTVYLEGQDLFSMDEDARAHLRAQRVGFVFQSFQLLGHLNALENVMLPLELMGKQQPKRAALEMLERVGLAQRSTHFPKVLSGGEQQRVALARAFVVQPALLLADEPTGSLDHATGERILSLMLELNAELGTTLVLVTHDTGLANRLGRRLQLEAGRLVSE